jgi:hypothetical protein
VGSDGLSCDDLVLQSSGVVYCHDLEGDGGRDCTGCICGGAVLQVRAVFCKQ